MIFKAFLKIFEEDFRSWGGIAIGRKRHFFERVE
jgi:hypothetical protein